LSVHPESEFSDRELGKEKTVILSTHILPEVEATCDRILIINRGRIVADGTSETLRAQAQGHEVLKIRIEDGDSAKIRETLKTISSIEKVNEINAEEGRFEVESKSGESSKKAIFRACVDNNWILTESVPYETKLEDIFRNLTVN
jgi:ABC-2 type transport system ATP-binding protein